MLADAACELFLEQGYEATSVTEITRRTGGSRPRFFNYCGGKSATLWFVLDAQIDTLVQVSSPEAAELVVGQGLGGEEEEARGPLEGGLEHRGLVDQAFPGGGGVGEDHVGPRLHPL